MRIHQQTEHWNQRVAVRFSPDSSPENEPPDNNDSVDWSKVGKGALYGGLTVGVFGGASKLLALAGVSAARNLSLPEFLVGVAGGSLVGAMSVWMGREEDVLPPDS